MEVSIRTVFEKSTIASLAEHIDGLMVAQQVQQSDKSTPLNIDDYVEEEL
jgi:hypothetical protein